jgi:hypothetical protein
VKFSIANSPFLESISFPWLRFSFDAGIFFMVLAVWLIVFDYSHCKFNQLNALSYIICTTIWTLLME